MTKIPVSIVIVSRDRPQLLLRAISAVSQLDYDPFELIIVACPAGIAALDTHPLSDKIKTIPFDIPNISIARNLGIQQAAGDIVAFLDDDAVPEPRWLRELIAPFDNPKVAACGGYVIGRNGFSYQWRGRSLSEDGFTQNLNLKGSDPVVFAPDPTRAIKTEGTNMAVRLSVLIQLGGFDPAFSFYMDETDLNMRLAKAGLSSAIAPRARVHHGFAPSRRRSKDRTPLDLTQIGKSTTAFLNRHTPKEYRNTAFKRHREEQRIRCLRLMQRGPLAPDDIAQLMRQFDDGFHSKVSAKDNDFSPLVTSANRFRPFPGRQNAQKIVISGRIWETRRIFKKAQAAARDGAIVVVYILDPTTRFHKRRFEADIWVQTGGIYGKSYRQDAAIKLTSFEKRVAYECKKCDITVMSDSSNILN